MGKRISNETKEEIIKLYNENVSKKEIIESMKISESSLYRILKNNNINRKRKDSKNSDNESNISDNESKKSDNESKKSDNESNKEENKDIFDEETFKRNLLNDNSLIESDNNENENKDDINESENNENENENKYNNISIQLIDNEKNEKIINDSIVLNKKEKSYINDIKKINNNENVIDTIKNLKATNVEEFIDKTSYIVRIRQYINAFEKDLYNVIGKNKKSFEQSLFTLESEKLKIILENIRIELNLNRNKDIFYNVVNTGLIGFEKIACYTGYDINGLTEDIMKDPDFQYDLKMISCEIDLSKYINPKSSLFLKIVRKCHYINNQNKIKNEFNKVFNDPEKLEKIKNLQNKIS